MLVDDGIKVGDRFHGFLVPGIPTRGQVLKELIWLTQDAGPGDCLFFSFSGHGMQVKDVSGDETDGYDEAIFLPSIEEDASDIILDDELHEALCGKLPAGVQVTALIDCCHCGSILDLKYAWHIVGKEVKMGRTPH